MKKVRCDFSAHTSIVVAIPDDAELDDAITMAEDYMQRNTIHQQWDLDDEGVAEVDSSEVAVNEKEE